MKAHLMLSFVLLIVCGMALFDKQRRKLLLWLSLAIFLFGLTCFWPMDFNPLTTDERYFGKICVSAFSLAVLRVVYGMFCLFYVWAFLKHVYLCWYYEKLKYNIILTLIEEFLLASILGFFVVVVAPLMFDIQGALLLTHVWYQTPDLLQEQFNLQEFITNYMNSSNAPKPDAIPDTVNIGDSAISYHDHRGKTLICMHLAKIVETKAAKGYVPTFIIKAGANALASTTGIPLSPFCMELEAGRKAVKGLNVISSDTPKK